jgi:hypothetical protein
MTAEVDSDHPDDCSIAPCLRQCRRWPVNPTEIVDDHGGPQGLLTRQDVIHQRGFFALEEPGHDRNRQAWRGGLHKRERRHVGLALMMPINKALADSESFKQ